MMNSNRICPAVGSQYKDSAVGLVFMESAVELAMETSKVESAVRNQAEAKLNQLEHNKLVGTMTNQLQVLKSEKNQLSLFKRLRRVARWSCNEEDQQEAIVYQQLSRCEDMESAVMTSALMSSQSADSLFPDARGSDVQSQLQWIQSQRKDFQTQCLSTQTQEDKSIVVEEDSGEAIDKPDASNSSIQSRAYMNQLLLYIQSRATVSSRRKSRRKKRRSSEALHPVAR
ncbi:receptor-like protein 12-like [Dorcoceras hygrometricum]|uniref:Receptor-like protein 12-like n=1 Tax=Dorcoceras hygrometricum TaxID=472368 RepID=A0A2Z7AKM7_9LAMI|nr:receptor-like protein 12-like [Dorcoceras hygrometricum]